MADYHDPDQRHTDDPELEKIKEDTAQIFVQFVRLHSHSASSNVAATDRTFPDSSTEPTTSPSCSSPSRQCLQVQETSSNATRGPSTLPRQKSREAARKDPHPKYFHSTRQPTAQIVPNSHCSVESTPKSRPDKLCLVSKHKRVPSSHSATGSDSSGKTTPAAQDPPLELMSPELSSSYPPMSSAQDGDLREGLVRSAEHASIAAASANCATSQERERHYASADKGGDPCAVQARKIADRLKNIGDDLEEEYIKSKLDDLTAALGDVVMNTSLQSMLYAYSNLSWRKVAEIFKLLCRALETTCYNDQLSRTVFEKVWDSILDNSVVPWIQNRGGWAALQRETEPTHSNTPNAPRRSHPLNPAQSEPVLLQNHSPTTTSPLCQPPFINGVSTLGRVSEAGRIMYTPQMPRHHHAPPTREQSSPCLPRDRSNSQHSQHSQVESASRSRLWSLTESGSFKREEDGMEDTEHNISELDMTQHDDEGDESETFLGSQEEEEGEIEEESQQDAEKTLTASAFHTSASFSSTSTSPPIIVPSSNSNSQPDAVSMDEFPIDSGIDISSLSLSCSPGDLGVNFIVGGGSCRPSSSVPKLNQTSLTSLSSVASASPVHTSPSSRKNSANGSGSGSGYFSDKTRPRSGGSLKESRPRHNGRDSPHYRTGSLRNSRSRPRYPQVTTPTNETSSQSAASSGHSSWMETPVRRMSTSAAVIYELVKDFFRSP